MLSDDELPALPEAASPTSYICVECSYVGSVGPTHIKRDGEACGYLALTIPAMFDADQMREYGLACERAAYERAQIACDTAMIQIDASEFAHDDIAFNQGCGACADAIQELEKEQK